MLLRSAGQITNASLNLSCMDGEKANRTTGVERAIKEIYGWSTGQRLMTCTPP
jgi:hypothetical protein